MTATTFWLAAFALLFFFGYVAMVISRNELLDAIKRHRDASLHNRCWLNDLELYTQARLSTSKPALPPKEEFLWQCGKYYEEQKNGS